VQRCAEHLKPVEQQIKAALARAEVLHQDETGLHVEGKRHWMHVSAMMKIKAGTGAWVYRMKHPICIVA
jgi:Transposase IS66 family